ncbi:MAG TPA: response regulator [Anaeromyxobacteraceae bacterium]|nr:response regulator [Anaeromyxobacteraceae bacterium]
MERATTEHGRQTLVWLVDDNSDLRENLTDILVDEGYAVRAAPGADAAARWLDSDDPPPDAVLLDLYMPGMTARYFASLMRAQPRRAASKIILVTAAEVHDKPGEGPWDAVLLKPFRIEQMLRLLRSLNVNPRDRATACPTG